MSVVAKCLIDAKYASSGDNSEYTCPANTRILIDKFTATNLDGSTRQISINIIPNLAPLDASNTVVKDKSIATTITADITELKNHVLSPGDVISVKASVGSMIVIRASGREVT